MGNPDLSVDSKAYFRKLAYSWSRCWCRDKEMGSVYLQAPTTLKPTADLSSFLRHSSNSPWSHHINSLTFWLAQHLATHWRQYSGVRQTGSERGKQLVCLAPGCCTASFSGSGLDTTHTHVTLSSCDYTSCTTYFHFSSHLKFPQELYFHYSRHHFNRAKWSIQTEAISALCFTNHNKTKKLMYCNWITRGKIELSEKHAENHTQHQWKTLPGRLLYWHFKIKILTELRPLFLKFGSITIPFKCVSTLNSSSNTW